jgi:hypothetical protein
MGFDFDRYGIGVQDIQAEVKQAGQEERSDQLSEGLKAILSTSDMLRKLKANEIKFSEPVLTQADNPVIFPHTINVIQGQTGVHKADSQKLFARHS